MLCIPTCYSPGMEHSYPFLYLGKFFTNFKTHLKSNQSLLRKVPRADGLVEKSNLSFAIIASGYTFMRAVTNHIVIVVFSLRSSLTEFNEIKIYAVHFFTLSTKCVWYIGGDFKYLLNEWLIEGKVLRCRLAINLRKVEHIGEWENRVS